MCARTRDVLLNVTLVDVLQNQLWGTDGTGCRRAPHARAWNVGKSLPTTGTEAADAECGHS